MFRSLMSFAVVCGCWVLPAASAADPAPPRVVYIVVQAPPGGPSAPGQPIVSQGQVIEAPFAPTMTDTTEPAPTVSKPAQKHAKFHRFLSCIRCEPDGFPTPVGNGNAWTEFMFVFGSSRQFFGNADSTVGCFWNTHIPPPPYR